VAVSRSMLQVLDTDDMPKCDKCKVKRPSTKILAVQAWPDVLVVHLKRFQYE
jgi:ubiquitin C-terminal hydrolase